MRKFTWHACLAPVAAGLAILLFNGCIKDKVTRTYKIFRPVYASTSFVMANIAGNPKQPFDSVGKICVLGSEIFVNEVGKGIHIIDNSDPVHPTQVSFLNIPGNLDIAVRNNMLYADMYSAIVAVNIADLRHPKVTSVVNNVFWGDFNVGGYLVSDGAGNLRINNQVIIGWDVKDTTVPVGYVPGANPGGPIVFMDLQSAVPSAASAAGGTGISGSMSRLALLGDYLYSIDERHEAGALSLADPANPALTRISMSGFDLETIYPFGNLLFLGSQEGVFIYDVSNPSQPVSKGTFSHGRACDPVIADGNYAYVTLHSGTYCGGSSNELDVLDIRNLTAPIQVGDYPMSGPQGLSKDGNLLFVCDGSNGGVKLFDASDPTHLQQVTQIGTTNAYDVIAANHRLLVVAAGGLYQYDYSDPANIRPLSFVSLK